MKIFKAIKVVSVLLAIFVISGCVTNTVGYSNPEFAGTRVDNLAVFVVALNQSEAEQVESAIVENLTKRGINARGFTRELAFTSDLAQLEKKAIEAGFKYGLIFSSQDAWDRRIVGATANGSATFSGDTMTYGSNSSLQTRTERNTNVQAILGSLTEGDEALVLWKGEGKRDSVGVFARFDFSAAAGVAEQILGDLEVEGFIPPITR
jgi:hypothetical protein